MGKRDTCEKEFLADNRIFADLVNGVVFGGKQWVHPEDLVEKDSTEVYSEEINGVLLSSQKYRDILKHATIKVGSECCYFVVGVENQTAINQVMVLRAMLYDALNYSKQVVSIVRKRQEAEGKKTLDDYFAGMRKTDKLVPVITIIFYWGSGEWTAPRSLHELFPDNLPKDLINCVPDYCVPVLSPKEIKDPSIFRTDLRAVVKAIAASDNKKDLKNLFETDPDFQSLDRKSALAIGTATDIRIKVSKNKEDVNMCKAVEEWKDDILKEGEAKYSALITAMSENGALGDIPRVAKDSKFREEMYKKYNIQ